MHIHNTQMNNCLHVYVRDRGTGEGQDEEEEETKDGKVVETTSGRRKTKMGRWWKPPLGGHGEPTGISRIGH